MQDIQGLDELYRRVLLSGTCAACGACVGGCPYLTSFRGKTVMLDRCTVEHGRCFAYCPMTFFDRAETSMAVFGVPSGTEAIGRVRDVKASRARDEQIATAGQGGGTVTSLMLTALEKRIIDSAVLTTVSPGETFPRGFVATTAAEVVSCCGSRYVGSHTLAALRSALDRGFNRIGVVGLPCQVRALRKMATYDLRNEGLKHRITLVVGLFCNWAFSSREFVSFLAEKVNVTGPVKCHIPPPPANVLEIETNAGLKSIPLEEVRPLIQAACNQCPDMTSEFADVSVGMHESRPGWNTLIVRTETGRDLVETALQTGALDVDVFPESELEHLERASLNKRKRERSANAADS
jgi:coenzyme F420 hydrogenase subunit beta